MASVCKLIFAAVACCIVHADFGDFELEADDECLAGNCSLTMLQLRRGRQPGGHHHDWTAEEIAEAAQAEDREIDFSRSPCKPESDLPCVNGYRQHPGCKHSFMYYGTNITGCTTLGSPNGNSWCSADDTHDPWDEWQYCTACVEEAILPLKSWDSVTAKLRCMTLDVNVGTAVGETYTFENAQDRTNTQSWLASSGKWPAAVAIGGVVNAGFLDWNTRASDIFPWWSSDPSDARSRITLRSLLNFASGFVTSNPADQHGFELQCMRIPAGHLYSIEQCAEQIYKNAKHESEPGTKWTYNGFHLQIALAMASKRSGKSARQVLKEYLYEPAGMRNTMVMGGRNPLVATFMFSTGRDYASFLRSLLKYDILPKRILDVMEAPAGINGLPEFAMGHLKAGNDQRWGGAMHPHMNRATGVYAVVMPKIEDYVAYFEYFKGKDSLRGQYIGAGMHVWDWIGADCDRLGALQGWRHA